MHVIQNRSMNEVLPKALELLQSDGDTHHGTGDSIECHQPVTLILERPQERLVYGGLDDLNPFESLFHALWFLGGRNDVHYLNKMFAGYHNGRSDDGETLHGALGNRIRNHFFPDEISIDTVDQLKSSITMLQANSARRDVVIEIWNTSADLGILSRDLPFATHIYLSIGHHWQLDMTVMYRSSNIYDMQEDSIAFSMMQEFIALALKVPVGMMTIHINHLTSCFDAMKGLCIGEQSLINPYDKALAGNDMVVDDYNNWLGELSMFLDEGPVMGMREPFLRHVASPMWQAWTQYKETTGSDVSGVSAALNTISRVRASDWREASREWLIRDINERTNAG